jgi:hypothetical protein
MIASRAKPIKFTAWRRSRTRGGHRPRNHGEKLFHQRTPFIATQSSTVMLSDIYPIPAMWHGHCHTCLVEFLIQLLTIIRTIANKQIALRSDHPEPIAELQNRGSRFPVEKSSSTRTR